MSWLSSGISSPVFLLSLLLLLVAAAGQWAQLFSPTHLGRAWSSAGARRSGGPPRLQVSYCCPFADGLFLTTEFPPLAEEFGVAGGRISAGATPACFGVTPVLLGLLLGAATVALLLCLGLHDVPKGIIGLFVPRRLASFWCGCPAGMPSSRVLKALGLASFLLLVVLEPRKKRMRRRRVCTVSSS